MRASGPAADEPDDPFERANLSPTLTGLPMIVRRSERGRARHDARVKASLAHGRRARPQRTASVSVRPTVEVVAGPELEGGTWSSCAKGSRSTPKPSVRTGTAICSPTRSFVRLKPVTSR